MNQFSLRIKHFILLYSIFRLHLDRCHQQGCQILKRGFMFVCLADVKMNDNASCISCSFKSASSCKGIRSVNCLVEAMATLPYIIYLYWYFLFYFIIMAFRSLLKYTLASVKSLINALWYSELSKLAKKFKRKRMSLRESAW